MRDYGEAIIDMMNIIKTEADDTVWLADCETVFDRLWALYVEKVGPDSRLREEFPEIAI